MVYNIVTSLIIQEWAKSLVFIFGGCCSTIIALENIISIEPKTGDLVTFCQFLFVAIEGFLRRIKFNNPIKNKSVKIISLEKNVVPLYKWVIMVLLFFSSSLLNSWAFSYHISVPLHIIFRSGSLLMNMLFSYLILKKKYSIRQVIDVIMITVGIIMATLTSAKEKAEEHEQASFNQWIMGILVLLFALIIGSVLGVYQEIIYKQYGKVWKEALFYSHVLSLPCFLYLRKNIVAEINTFNKFPRYEYNIPGYPSFKISIPISWLYLIVNVLSQFFCVTGVHKLSSISTSLTLNLVLSLRKFASLMLSVILFKNTFKLGHWISTIILFLGTFLYFKDTSVQKKKEKTEKKEKIQ